MKIIAAFLICVLYCVLGIGSGETCFRSEILRKRLEYKNGGEVHTLFVNAIKDFASYLRVEIDSNIIPRPDNDRVTQLHTTIAYFAFIAEAEQLYSLHGQVEFYDDKGTHWKTISAKISVGEKAISQISIDDDAAIWGECKQSAYLNSLIFPPR
ncbi:unnamed protein product [Angiostrongylus costaricensis]|uniref:Signal peptide-containing protein n=1 Tax=Angiostrongylus costaricensis TaxID=334426 RepID=A0A0R3Q0C4_ANGCS|nr:unnamed protein product [Angiostrongylus costaricensis]